MATLTIHGIGVQTAEFSPPITLDELLAQTAFTPAKPCGGRGQCGKCAVAVTGAVSAPNDAEQRFGVRLACQTVLLGDAQVYLPAHSAMRQIELGESILLPPSATGGYAAAIDIGTTTLALKLFNLSDGRCIATSALANPQISVAADVMGRIGAALQGQQQPLRCQIMDALQTLLTAACTEASLAPNSVSSLVITGNTTMLYLLTGHSPEALSHAPFEADTLFDTTVSILGHAAYLPPCMSAFVGADITCAVLASGMCDGDQTALLCDVGTNGEIALWHGGILYVTSTAAGPAFEGAGISCGCASVDGAIDRVGLYDGRISVHTIGDKPPVGLCGSGLIDAMAAFLATENIAPTGAIDAPLRLCEGVTLQAADIRAVQLAKAAIAAGIEILLQHAGIEAADVARFYIAGGFGSHLNLQSAAAIGLFSPELAGKATILGNAALTGAAQLLVDDAARCRARRIATGAVSIRLSGNAAFNDAYIDHMFFGDPDEL